MNRRAVWLENMAVRLWAAPGGLADIPPGGYTDVDIDVPLVSSNVDNAFQELDREFDTLHISGRWRHNWRLAQVVNSHLVNRQPGFDLPWQQWSLLNRFRIEQGHCRKRWRLTDTDLCPCSETQTISHIVKSHPLTKLNGGFSRLHSVDEDAVSWLTSYGL